ncbi:MAG: leucine--tRNA ligase, partial [Spirochaetaceae bacterium]
SKDTGNLAFNTAISQMMIYSGELAGLEVLPRKLMEPFVLLLCPYAPHIAEELWELCGKKPSLLKQAWPAWDEALTTDDVITLVVQINGKVRSKLEVARGLTADQLKAEAMASSRIKELVGGKEIVRVIAVPDRLVNIVLKG